MQDFQSPFTTAKSRTYDFTKIRVRSELDAPALRQLAVKEKDRRIAQRILAIANCLEDRKRCETADLAGVARGSVQTWLNRFNKSGLAGLQIKERPGRPRKLAPEGIAELINLLTHDLDSETYRTGEARLQHLRCYIKQRFGVSYGLDGMRRLVFRLGFRWQGGRFIRPES